MEAGDRDPIHAADREGQYSADFVVFLPGARATAGQSSADPDARHADTSRSDDHSGGTSKDSRVSMVVKDVVARSLSDLIDDWHRMGQNLSYADVTRVSTKRDLDGIQLAKL